MVLQALIQKGKHLNEGRLQILNSEITKEDLKRVLFSIPDGKSPGLMVSTTNSTNTAGRW